MNKWIKRCCLLLAMSLNAAVGAEVNQQQTVVLLHGLARTADSMSRIADELVTQGYRVCNINYPSRYYAIETLAKQFVEPAIKACIPSNADEVHFVTHSLGGIIVRQLAASMPDFSIGRVVMLSPPNQGSEVVDTLGDLRVFEWINGPAGLQLGTDQLSPPKRLAAASFEVGVITGSLSVNPLLSLLIPGVDDGKVSVASAHLAGMRDFCVVPASHTFIMNKPVVISQTINFLAQAEFDCPHSE